MLPAGTRHGEVRYNGCPTDYEAVDHRGPEVRADVRRDGSWRWLSIRRTAVLVSVGVLLAGCSSSSSSDWGRKVLAAGGPDVASLEVTGTETVAAEGELVRLSPDGTRLLHLSGERCASVLDGSDERCVDEVSADLRRARWSPDSTKIVFTDDFWREFREPDVRVFDVTSGELTNLTDDGVDEYDNGDPDQAARLDLLPSWSPDGTVVRFARGAAKGESLELVSVGVDGGEVSTIREVECALLDLTALVWSADRVAWTCGAEEPEVWLAGLDGGEPERVLTVESGAQVSLSFSADGQWLLVNALVPPAEVDDVGRGPVNAVPTDGGDPVPVADGRVAYPTWSPGGHALAYVEPPGTVTVVAAPGGEPRELHSAEHVFGADATSLGWAHGKLLVNADGELTLLHLDG